MNALAATLLAIALGTTLVVLLTGFFAMARGGPFNRKYGNRLMRLRVLAQFTALVLIVIAMLIRNSG